MATLAGKKISQNGLGLMRLIWHYGPTPDEKAFKVLKTALTAGANVWNGADFYGLPNNNSLHLMNRYFTAYPEDAEKTFSMDCSRNGLRAFADNALKILDGKKKIDIFGLGRVDPNVPIEESVRALAELREEGKIGGIQLSEVRADTIRRAARVTKIDMVEAEVSLWSREVFENGIAEACAENDIVLVAHTPLGAGMLTGAIKTVDDLPQTHHRMVPRFQPESIAQNRLLVEQLEKLAESKGCTTAQLALTWVKVQSKKPGMPFIVPIAGARSEERVLENMADVELDDNDLDMIQSILDKYPVAGARYPPAAARLNEY
ncbi:NADP-dependent oxidoreductase domain-containing protein [Aspergillus caelatus]|uniref:NADP-dependent oxidoreductase domain-containing protein n=1 Tax=Aspergillus caelatus TaxID=61420 RepID=A0A5N7ACQ4_9EURO|nr:NADP-dependent oxidoreductase domain-containing protein [Aspergillus caelatus]KAE8367651.1 NADP-dependent oxidoreductase domain-containing protein [Aspergillus caelatus]